MRSFCLAFVVLLIAACGKDNGGGTGGDVIDANSGAGDGGNTIDSGSSTPDANSSQGTQGPGQFCDTLPDGGPYCMDGLECCDDKICHVTGDCGGSTGFIPCDCTDDCPNSFLCCESTDQTFCTKRNGCDQVGGTEITTCP